VSLRVVTVEIEPSVRDAFASWYETVHVPDVLACPGWLSARRYECGTRFLTVYEIGEGAFDSARLRAIAHWDRFAPFIVASSRRTVEPGEGGLRIEAASAHLDGVDYRLVSARSSAARAAP
jgi:hypothetical protein